MKKENNTEMVITKELVEELQASNIKKVSINQELSIKNIKTNILEFDFDKLNGRNLISAERRARAMGDMTPAIVYSMTYQTILASIASGANLDDIMDLPAQDLLDIVALVNDFLFNRA